jgi:hypothetical protein
VGDRSPVPQLSIGGTRFKKIILQRNNSLKQPSRPLFPPALCPHPSALCPLPPALCPHPSALCLLPSALILLPSASCPLPSSFCPSHKCHSPNPGLAKLTSRQPPTPNPSISFYDRCNPLLPLAIDRYESNRATAFRNSR